MTQYKLVILEEASLEALVAYNYYETIQPGLGEAFLQSLQQRYSDLSQHPEYYSFIAGDRALVFRDVKLKRFPYVIIYEISGRNVIVYSVHLTHRKRKV